MKIYNYEEDRYYSLAEGMFSECNHNNENKSKKHKKRLSEINSNRGLGRAIITSPITGMGSIAGGYLSKSKADDADAEGMSDADIIRIAKKYGGKVGAASGAISGGTAGMIRGNTVGRKLINGISGAASGAVLGYIGGSEAARVNTKGRLDKRIKEENKEDSKTK